MEFIPYPEITDEDFYKKIFNKREFRQTLVKSNFYNYTMEEACRQDIFKTAKHQVFVRNFLSPYTPYNGMLLFHGTGVGKTCGAVGITEGFRNLMDQTGKKIRILTPNETIKENFLKALYDESKEELEKKNHVMPGSYRCTGNAFTAENNKQLIGRYYEFYGFREFTNAFAKLSADELKDKFQNSVLVIDEAHGIATYNPQTGEIDSHVTVYTFLKNLFQTLNVSLKLVLLTATPMKDNINEFKNMIELLWLNDKRNWPDTIDLNNQDQISDLVKGYVSYVEGNNPVTFPALYNAPDGTYNPTNLSNLFTGNNAQFEFTNDAGQVIPYNLVKVTMSPEQTLVYNETTQQQMNGFTQTLVRLSNITINGGFTVNLAKDIESLDISLLADVSPKLHHMLSTMTGTATEGISYIYSNFTTGGAEAAKLVLMANGFIPFSKNAKTVVNNVINDMVVKKLPEMKPIYQFLDKEKRPSSSFFRCARCMKVQDNCVCEQGFAIATFVYITGSKDDDRAKVAGRKQTRQTDIDATTTKSNLDGTVVKAIIGTNATSQGVDLRYVRNVFILDPWWNNTRIYQSIGRASRHCSHSDLPPNQRNVTVFKYCSVPDTRIDNKESIDEHIYRVVMSKDVEVKRIERIVKEAAVDCELQRIRNSNPYKKDYSRECEYKKCEYTCKTMENIRYLRSVYKTSRGNVKAWVSKGSKLRLVNLSDLYPEQDALTVFESLKKRHGVNHKDGKVYVDEPLDDMLPIDESTFDANFSEAVITATMREIAQLFMSNPAMNIDTILFLLKRSEPDRDEGIVYIALQTLVGNGVGLTPVVFMDRLKRPGQLQNRQGIYTFTPFEYGKRASDLPASFLQRPLKLKTPGVPLTSKGFTEAYTRVIEDDKAIEELNEDMDTLRSKDSLVDTFLFLNTLTLDKHRVIVEKCLVEAFTQGTLLNAVEYYIRSMVLFLGNPDLESEEDRIAKFSNLTEYLDALKSGNHMDLIFHVLGNRAFDPSSGTWSDSESLPDMFNVQFIPVQTGWTRAFKTQANDFYLFIDLFEGNKVVRSFFRSTDEAVVFQPDMNTTVNTLRTLYLNSNFKKQPQLKLLIGTQSSSRGRVLSTYKVKDQAVWKQAIGLPPKAKENEMVERMLELEVQGNDSKVYFMSPFLLEYYCPQRKKYN